MRTRRLTLRRDLLVALEPDDLGRVAAGAVTATLVPRPCATYLTCLGRFTCIVCSAPD